MKCIPAAVVLLTCMLVGANTAYADEEIFSGPQKGEKLPPLKLRNVFSEPAVDSDPVAQAEGKPLLVIFVHKRERPAFGLTNALMRYAQTRKKDGLNSATVYLSPDLTEATDWMKRVRRHFPEGASFGLSPDGAEGPGSYGLNRDVSMTVLVGKDGKVTENFALVQPSLQADGPKIAGAIVKAVGSGKIPNLTRFSGNQMRAASPLDPKLAALVRQLIQKDAKQDDVDKAAGAIEEFLEKNKEARKSIGAIGSRIISAGKLENYGTKHAQAYLTKWTQAYGPKKNDEPAKRSDRKKSDRSRSPSDERKKQ